MLLLNSRLHSGEIIIDKRCPVATLILKHYRETKLYCVHKQTLSSMRAILDTIVSRCYKQGHQRI